jgi:oligopeptidase B
MTNKTSDNPLAPPVAAKHPKSDTIHGDARQDDYFWLREKEKPEVTAYLEAENTYTDKIMAHTKAFQNNLYDEMLARIKETDLSVPYLNRGYYYYHRTEEGKQYEIYCRKKGSIESVEEVTLDLNELAAGKEYMSLGPYTVSDDNQLLAYATDETGFREYTLYIKDLRTGELLPDTIEKVGAVVWATDNRTIFYTTEDHTKRQYRLYRHTLGEPNDTLIYEEKDELFYLFARRARSGEYIFLSAGSHTTTEVWYLRADQPEGTWQTLAERIQDREYDADHREDAFYLRINDTGRNFRLVRTTIHNPAQEHWQEIVPHREEVMLEDVDVFSDHYVLYERRNGLPEIRIVGFENEESHTVPFAEPVYEVFSSINLVWETRKLRYNYQSLVTPNSVLEYDLDTRTSALLKQTEVLGGYDGSGYTSERLSTTVRDGVEVPISLVYKNEFQKNGQAPLLLIGYGSYGWSYPVTFSSLRLSLLDRGVAIGIAHVRGGGEMGKAWHDQGRMMHKMRSFTDFIDCAEVLIAQRYTSPQHLIIEGGSAGGLLMGAVTNMRPDLFKAVVSHVPFVDVLNTMLDASLPLTVGEYEEWGNPNIEDDYLYMKQYCPYTNLRAMEYPVMLIKTSLNDSQVMYWEPAKYVAKLRTLKQDGRPLLLVTNMGAGHGGASGRYDHLREIALDYAFMLDQWKIG